MANRMSAGNRDCRFCGKSYGTRGIKAHEKKCPQRDDNLLQIQAEAEAFQALVQNEQNAGKK